MNQFWTYEDPGLEDLSKGVLKDPTGIPQMALRGAKRLKVKGGKLKPLVKPRDQK